MAWQYLLLIPIAVFHLVCTLRERKTLIPPGKLIDLGGYKLHLWVKGNNSDRPTIVLDHSLGGIEGYLLIDRLAELTQVCIYDRLCSLSLDFELIAAANSSHFVWTDEPEVMIRAVKQLLDREL